MAPSDLGITQSTSDCKRASSSSVLYLQHSPNKEHPVHTDTSLLNVWPWKTLQVLPPLQQSCDTVLQLPCGPQFSLLPLFWGADGRHPITNGRGYLGMVHPSWNILGFFSQKLGVNRAGQRGLPDYRRASATMA